MVIELQNGEMEVTTNLITISPEVLARMRKFQFYRIGIENLKWDDREFYRVLKEIVTRINDLQLGIIQTAGFLVAIQSNTSDDQEIIKMFKEMLSQETRIPRDEIHLEKIENDEIVTYQTGINLLRLLLGTIIAKTLQQYGFQKIQSKGACGVFLIPNIQQQHEELVGGVEWILEVPLYGRVERVLEVDIITDDTSTPSNQSFPNFHATIELRTKLIGSQLLSEELRSKNVTPEQLEDVKEKDTTVKELVKDRMNPKYRRILPTGEEVGGETFKLVDIIYDPDFEILTSYRHYKNVKLRELLAVLGYDINRVRTESQGMVAVLKPKLKNGKKHADPNARYVFPVSLLQKSLDTDTLRLTKHSIAYNKFSQIKADKKMKLTETLRQRYHVLQDLFRNRMSLKRASIKFASPSIRESYRDGKYGRIPKLSLSGVEDWGNLERIYLCHDPQALLSPNLLEEFLFELGSVFNSICKIMKKERILISKVKLNEAKFRRNIDPNPTREGETCLIIISKDSRLYKDLKIQWTVKNDQAVQYLKPRTLLQMKRKNNGLRMLVEALARQIIAKTGGLPYRLSPNLLPRAAIIGLDRSRDSFGQRPAASAGIAAVTPIGIYLAGTSTQIDSQAHDFIDVAKVGKPLIDELVKKKERNEIDLDFIAILRDGSPQICRREADQWEKLVKSHQLDLIFVAARKQHPYRVYPQLQGRRLDHPLIFTEMPTSPSDFMTVTTLPPLGTPKPVLYTIMKNTTNMDVESLKSTLGSVIASLSLLCWESSTPTSQPLPLHYADKLAEFTALTGHPWDVTKKFPMFI